MNNDAARALHERFLLQKEYLGENKLINNITPLVSITIATYQQVNYIKNCLDGVLMQKTNFPFEIIVGEDGSIDGTQEICKEYAKKYPNKIRLFIRDRNLSQYTNIDGKTIRFNGIWNRMSSRGKYIAWCEGDDYWTDPLKLQKQIDILEKNSDIGCVYTKVKYFYDKEKLFKEEFGKDYISFPNLLRRNVIPTLSVIFRTSLYNQYISEIKPENKDWKMGDYPLWLWLSYNSKLYFMNEITGVYRVLPQSASHELSRIKVLPFRINSIKISLYFARLYSVPYEDIEAQLLWSQFEYACLSKDKKLILELNQQIKDCYRRSKNIRILILTLMRNTPTLFNFFLLVYRFFKKEN
ncbi:glycosyltransferase [Phocaeicola coprophilus]|uniref:glycosyltransferase n=1 Tax=Phocaeicola coprophilus TaxID=387090 RepID=UPI00255C8BB1|nr:glycosyltransferase [Phocaeicola coprophilus]